MSFTVEDGPRTRGPLIAAAKLKEAIGRDGTTLHRLFRALRRHVGGLPLTIVVFGRDHETIESLLRLLSRICDPRQHDAIWVVTDREAAAEEYNGVVVLSFDDARHRTIYENLIVDVAFFGAFDRSELRHVAGLARRCGVMLIHEANDQVTPLLKEAQRHHVTAALWSDQRVTEFNPGTTRRMLKRRFKTPDAARLAALLLAHVRYLDGHPATRRLDFRQLLEETSPLFPDPRELKAKLIEHADRDRWPSWAVDTLGAFYVPISGAKPAAGNGYVWSHVAACIPPRLHVRETGSLCNGAIRRVSVPKAAVPELSRLARIFEIEVGQLEFGSDRAVIGAVNSAMQVASAAFAADAQASKKIDRVRHALLRQHDLPVAD